jgi:hypothetical protein
MQIWINGERQTVVVGSSGLLPLDTLMGINGPGFTQTVGAYDAISAQSAFVDGYIAEVHFIDGTALGPESFGQTVVATNQWKPIEYTGSYGTNGFYQTYVNAEDPTDIVDISSNTHTIVAVSAVKSTAQK